MLSGLMNGRTGRMALWGVCVCVCVCGRSGRVAWRWRWQSTSQSEAPKIKTSGLRAESPWEEKGPSGVNCVAVNLHVGSCGEMELLVGGEGRPSCPCHTCAWAVRNPPGPVVAAGDSHPYMTPGKTIALTIWTFAASWCLCFLICYLDLS